MQIVDNSISTDPINSLSRIHILKLKQSPSNMAQAESTTQTYRKSPNTILTFNHPGQTDQDHTKHAKTYGEDSCDAVKVDYEFDFTGKGDVFGDPFAELKPYSSLPPTHPTTSLKHSISLKEPAKPQLSTPTPLLMSAKDPIKMQPDGDHKVSIQQPALRSDKEKTISFPEPEPMTAEIKNDPAVQAAWKTVFELKTAYTKLSHQKAAGFISIESRPSTRITMGDVVAAEDAYYIALQKAQARIPTTATTTYETDKQKILSDYIDKSHTVVTKDHTYADLPTFIKTPRDQRAAMNAELDSKRRTTAIDQLKQILSQPDSGRCLVMPSFDADGKEKENVPPFTLLNPSTDDNDEADFEKRVQDALNTNIFESPHSHNKKTTAKPLPPTLTPAELARIKKNAQAHARFRKNRSVNRRLRNLLKEKQPVSAPSSV